VRGALDWLADLEGWRWVLAWVVATVGGALVVDAALVRVLELVGVPKLFPEPAWGFRAYSEDERVRFFIGGLLRGFVTVVAVASAQVPLIMSRVAHPGRWPAVELLGGLVGGALALLSTTRVGSLPSELIAETLEFAGWAPFVETVVFMVGVSRGASAAFGRSAVETLFLRGSIGGVRTWVLVSTALGALSAVSLRSVGYGAPSALPPEYVAVSIVRAAVQGATLWWLLARNVRPSAAGITP
jgi:hypothetical protein